PPPVPWRLANTESNDARRPRLRPSTGQGHKPCPLVGGEPYPGEPSPCPYLACQVGRPATTVGIAEPSHPRKPAERPPAPAGPRRRAAPAARPPAGGRPTAHGGRRRGGGRGAPRPKRAGRRAPAA